MKKLLPIVIAGALYMVTASQAVAAGDTATNCQPIYGGGQTCVQVGNIVLDKKVQNPSSNVYVDHLGVNDPKYSPDGTVSFKIVVKNTGSETLSKVTVKDTLPQYVSFVSGPGNYDSKNNVLNFELSDLKANESREYTIVGKIASVGNLPKDQGITCVVNQAQATANDQSATDNSQFCVQKQVLGSTPTTQTTTSTSTSVPTTTKGGLKIFPAPSVTTTPSTGPELLALAGLLPTGALGFFIRKKAIQG